MLLSNSVGNISLGHAGIYGILGYAVVFLGLILLMFLVIVLGKAFVAAAKRSAKKPQTEVKEEQPAQVSSEPAPGSAGQLKLHGVEPKTAAMLMAIVADKLQKPVNELRFISIKEVTK